MASLSTFFDGIVFYRPFGQQRYKVFELPNNFFSKVVKTSLYLCWDIYTFLKFIRHTLFFFAFGSFILSNTLPYVPFGGSRTLFFVEMEKGESEEKDGKESFDAKEFLKNLLEHKHFPSSFVFTMSNLSVQASSLVCPLWSLCHLDVFSPPPDCVT